MKKTFLFLSCFLGFQFLYAQLPQVSTGSIKRYEQFQSKHVDPRNVDVWLPEGYSPGKKYAVVYFHDGQMLFDAGSTWNKQEWGVDETFGRLMKEGQIRDCIVVGVWNITQLRRAEYFPQKTLHYLPAEERALALKDKLYADKYLKFLVEELKPFIDKNYSTRKDAKSTFLAGSSMGGLISLYGVCEYPNVFGGAACLSIHSPLLTSERVMQQPDNEYGTAFRAYVKAHLPQHPKRKIYFDYGTKTLDALYQSTQPKLDATMKEAGYDEQHWITKRYVGDAHDEVSWAKRLHVPILFLLKR